MGAVRKSLIIFVLAGMTMLRPVTALAASYKQALEAYSDQKYSQSYKKAMSVAREERGTRRGKALMLAAAAVLELAREKKAKVLFKKALDADPDLDLPDVVRSRRAQRFFDDIRVGRETRSSSTAVKVEQVPNAFNRVETYLPLGINQLVQEKYLLGLTLGAAQGFAVYFAYIKAVEANQAEQKLQAVRQTAILSGDDINPVFLEFVDKNQAFIKRSRQESQLSLLLAVASYGGSILEAGLNPPARSRLAVLAPTYPLFAKQFDRTQIRFDILNPLLSTQGLQLSLQF